MKEIEKSGKNSAAGFRLRFVPERQVYQIHSGNHGAFEGTLTAVWQKMNWEYEISNKEIRIALQEMEFNDHNVANFGIWGTFIFTQPK